MAKPLRPKRGTTAKNDAFVGLASEITVDTEKHSIRVHDGVTAGGHALATDADLAAVRVAAENAQSSANGAQSSANGAQSSANEAQSAADAAQAAANAAQATADACLPLAGGTMTGNVYVTGRQFWLAHVSGETQYRTVIQGATGWSDGASVYLHGKDYADDATNKGVFQIRASDGTNGHTLLGKPDGTMTWGGFDVVISAAKTLANNGYVKFSNGLIVQWGYTGSGTSGTVTFPTAFSSGSSYRMSVQAYAGDYNDNNPEVKISDRSGTGFSWQRKSGKTNDWIAIGF